MKNLPKRDTQIQMLLDSGMVKEVLSYSKDPYSNADVILLNDGKTFIVLSEQDYYSYHDCSSSARHIDVHQDKKAWNSYLKEYHPAKDLT
jgi:hypothetical protein